jgi:hypothetical protein
MLPLRPPVQQANSYIVVLARATGACDAPCRCMSGEFQRVVLTTPVLAMAVLAVHYAACW